MVVLYVKLNIFLMAETSNWSNSYNLVSVICMLGNLCEIFDNVMVSKASIFIAIGATDSDIKLKRS